MSIFNPLFSAALTVFLPKAAMMVSFCLKSGKFLNNDSIPEGLKTVSYTHLTLPTILRV